MEAAAPLADTDGTSRARSYVTFSKVTREIGAKAGNRSWLVQDPGEHLRCAINLLHIISPPAAPGPMTARTFLLLSIFKKGRKHLYKTLFLVLIQLH